MSQVRLALVVPPLHWSSAVQPHSELLQDRPPCCPHRLPHPPQLSTSPVGFVSQPSDDWPLQSRNGAWQIPIEHAPDEQPSTVTFESEQAAQDGLAQPVAGESLATQLAPHCFCRAPQPAAPPLFEPPALVPPLFEPPALAPPAFEPPALAPPAFEPPALAPPAFEPPALASPVFEPPVLESTAPASGVPLAPAALVLVLPPLPVVPAEAPPSIFVVPPWPLAPPPPLEPPAPGP